MKKRASDNLRITRKYLLWLGDARGLSAATVDQASASIATFGQYLGAKDFRAFNSEVARAFKRYLEKPRPSMGDKPRAKSTVNGILRDISAFLIWLADQSGYRSKITRSDIAYLAPDRKSENARRGTLWKPHPSAECVSQVILGMPTRTTLERRNRAFVAFLLLTGARESAAISLRLCHVDLAESCVNFDGRSVDTKFGKTFTTAFFPVGKEVEEIVRAWVMELRTEQMFSGADPLFPKTDVGVGRDRLFQVVGIKREPWSSPSAAAKIFKDAFVEAGQPPYPPHRVRDTLVDLGKRLCRTPEEFKSWSQNLGHDDVMTTFTSYGTVPTGRQVELMAAFREMRKAL
jgi:integrase